MSLRADNKAILRSGWFMGNYRVSDMKEDEPQQQHGSVSSSSAVPAAQGGSQNQGAPQSNIAPTSKGFSAHSELTS